jgi:hypothetical protein
MVPECGQSRIRTLDNAAYLPPDWQPLGPADERYRCYGNNGRTSFFGHGLVDAAAAAGQ